MEPVLLLSISFVHEVLVDFDAVVDYSVCLIFNFSLLVFGDSLKVSDVEMRSFDCLFGSVLPDMWAKHFAARCEYNVSAGVVSSKLRPAERVYLDVYSTSLKFCSYWEVSVKYMQDYFAYFLSVYYIERLKDSFDL